MDRYAKHQAIIDLGSENEQLELTPMDLLTDYYWRSYRRVEAHITYWKLMRYGSFCFGVQYWSYFMRDCPDIALGPRIYQRWNNPGTKADLCCQHRPRSPAWRMP